MNLAKMPLEQLEALHADMGEYLAVRRQHEAAGRVQELEAERRQMALELDEARAQLAAQTEMAGRLMASLKLSVITNGHNGAKTAVEMPETEPAKKTGRKPKPQSRPVPEDTDSREPAKPAEDALAFNEDLSASGTLTLDDLADLDFGNEW